MKIDAKSRLLIVEDDAAMSSCYVELLGDVYEFMVLSSGTSAVNAMQATEDIDLVILDYKLPDLSGMEVLKEIKKSKPHIPVIVTTAYGDEEVAVKSFRYGARDYIKKPFCFKELREKIEFFLSLEKIQEKLQSGKKRNALFHERKSKSGIRSSAVNRHNNNKLQKAVRFIDDNFMTKINLSMAANKACMSKHHFSRTFKKAIGMNYQDYLNSRRVEKAKEMLRTGDLTITEIAFSVGYGDITHFTKIFKKVVGQTPSDYKTLSQNALHTPDQQYQPK